MHLPRPDKRTIAILLAVALALLVIGMILKGIAYLLVIAAVVLAIYVVVGHRRDGDATG